MTGEDAIPVFCTNRGLHTRVSLGYWDGLITRPPGNYSPDWPTSYGQRAKTPLKIADTSGARKMKDIEPAIEIDHTGSQEWRCTECGRNPQLKPLNALTLWASLQEVGITSLDISALPF